MLWCVYRKRQGLHEHSVFSCPSGAVKLRLAEREDGGGPAQRIQKSSRCTGSLPRPKPFGLGFQTGRGEGNTGPSCLTFVVRSALTRRLQLPEPPVLYERRVQHYAGCLCTWPFRFSRGILHTITSAKSLRGKRIRVELASKITNSPRPAISWCVCQRGNLVQLFSVAHQCRRLVRRRKRRHGAPGYVYFNFSLVSGDSRADHLHGGGLEED